MAPPAWRPHHLTRHNSNPCPTPRTREFQALPSLPPKPYTRSDTTPYQNSWAFLMRGRMRPIGDAL
ncbi:hypothetical protein FCV25MIE_34408, partial [Fagus crenata]